MFSFLKKLFGIDEKKVAFKGLNRYLYDIERLKKLKPNWDSGGGGLPNKVAIDLAESVVLESHILGLKIDYLAPVDESVIIEFNYANFILCNIEVYNDGTCIVQTKDRLSNKCYLEFFNAKEAVEKLCQIVS